MIIELHILQSFAPSNLNRDDSGAPKSAIFGDVRRARISSQCLKRSARLLLPDYGVTIGKRSKDFADKAAELLADRGRDLAEARTVAGTALEELGLPTDKDNNSKYSLFLRSNAVELLADICDSNYDALLALVPQKTKEAKETKTGASKTKSRKKSEIAGLHDLIDASEAVDIALFGRMIANNKNFSVDAASQVAHAISTHAVAGEYDYFTAVDDLQQDGDSGADMIGTVEFNAACYYRYANLDLAQFSKNLPEDPDLVHNAARAWLQAFIHAIPTGKQNSMAAHNPPSLILAVVRRHGVWNLANAFADPVKGTFQKGIIQASADAFLSQFDRIATAYGDENIVATRLLSVDAKVDTDLTQVRTVTELVDDITGALA
ncbi:type I-E CRISPR-associated protein Cas7/Cse4/CasC [Streptosporangium sp. NPDC023963]|uniref:type I-E CRISPR-associated protein Cas7/Cse4/CasC n=1 Tax=Streptosporangium sp. NPDC023963 TaxID=3155608 RepID=UPI0034231C44